MNSNCATFQKKLSTESLPSDSAAASQAHKEEDDEVKHAYKLDERPHEPKKK